MNMYWFSAEKQNSYSTLQGWNLNVTMDTFEFGSVILQWSVGIWGIHAKKCMLWAISNHSIHYMADAVLHFVQIVMLCCSNRDLKLFV